MSFMCETTPTTPYLRRSRGRTRQRHSFLSLKTAVINAQKKDNDNETGESAVGDDCDGLCKKFREAFHHFYFLGFRYFRFFFFSIFFLSLSTHAPPARVRLKGRDNFFFLSSHSVSALRLLRSDENARARGLKSVRAKKKKKKEKKRK